jgi:hypothetical protein
MYKKYNNNCNNLDLSNKVNVNSIDSIENNKNNISVNIQGRLGNQLFEIISCWSYSKKYNMNFVLQNKYQLENPIYYNVFFKHIPCIYSLKNYITIRYPVFQDISNISNISRISNVLVDSYLQNSNNFNEYRDEILDLFFNIKEKTLKNNFFFIHIRLTDFYKSPLHNINLDEYYKKAIEYMSSIIDMSSNTFYIISDDINNAKKKEYLNYIPNKIYIDNNEYDEIRTINLFKECSGAIIGHSTFAWWGAYIINCPDKIVVCPDKFLNGNYDFSGLYLNYKVIKI